MDERTFTSRTKQFCLKVTRLMGNLPRAGAADVMARQLLPYANSIGANYRAACQGQSSADVLAKLAIVEERWTRRPTGWRCWLIRTF